MSLLPSESAMIAELLEMEDPMMLHEFVADCLVENPYPLEDVEAVVHEMNPISSSIGSVDSSSSTPTAADTRNDEEDTKRASLTNTSNNPRKRPKRHPEQCQNHIIAERQRRQTLSERFIALSALLPGLKKVDKTTILGAAIDHMKQLKERVKVLEDQNARKTADSIVVIKQSQVINITENSNIESDSSTCNNDENLSNKLCDHQLPDIEAQFLNNNILIKINCEVQKGVLIKIMSELENLQIVVITTNSMPFAAKTLDITIVAQTESSFNMRPQDVVQRLRSIFHQ